MRLPPARTRTGLAGLTLWAVLALVASCSGPPPPPEGAGPPSGPTAPGAALAWSRPADTRQRPVAMVGDTVLLVDDDHLLGLRRTDGAERWRLPFTDHDRFTVAGAQVVVERDHQSSFVPTEPTPSTRLEVFDAATGTLRWRAEGPLRAVPRADAVYVVRRSDPAAAPVVTAYEVADGAPRWTASGFSLANDTIGTRLPYAPPSGRYLVATQPGGPVAAVDTRTGARLRGQLDPHAWYDIVADQTLVVTDDDPPPGETRCTVAVSAVDVDGANPRTTTAFSGRHEDNTCERNLGNTENGQAALGSGTRMAVSSPDGRPQVLDLATGQVVWTATAPGAPIDGDATKLLVRRHADAGDLALLDLATGRQRWTAPDSGLPGTSASWDSAVTGGLVAVAGAVADRPVVDVYDADTGRLRGRFRSWLAGAGDDWVAVIRSSPTGQATVEFWTF